jgi:hypothetical protein
MKNFGLTLLMMLFVGVGSTMAQDKKSTDSDAAATKTEVKADAHKCAADCTKACCAKKEVTAHKCSSSSKKACCAKAAAGDKKACAPGCKKDCCTADAGKAKKDAHDHDSHEGHDHPH